MLRNMFRSRDNALPTFSNDEVDAQEGVPQQERPLICLIDIEENTVEALISKGFNCTDASFGTPNEVPNTKKGHFQLCLPNHAIPTNLHEYDIVVIDLSDSEPIAFEANDHRYTGSKQPNQVYFVCEYPQTIFDPRTLASIQTTKNIGEIQTKESFVILFSSGRENIDYQPAILQPYGITRNEKVTFDNYTFLNLAVSTQNKSGVQTAIVSDITGTLGEILQKYNDQFVYEITFQHPKVWDETGNIKVFDDHFVPLMINSTSEIVSFIKVEESSLLFVFPQLEDKTAFLMELLQHYLPRVKPALFPFNTEFAWVNSDTYRLPNEAEFLTEKEDIQRKYQEDLTTIDQKIEQNRAEYQFLHQLITESGDTLVKAVELYLQWLGFDNVVNCDETYAGQNEEDLQVTLESGLLVIEVKGIGGTSKDSECSQVSKIRYRRLKERQMVDVSALYIVNHQRYLPPISRANPPFSKQQIEDALSDERGLLTTYDLFKVFFAIHGGYITKLDARNSLLSWGLVEFHPSKCISLGSPNEIHYGGLVCILEIEDITVALGDELIAAENGKYRRIKVVGLKNNDVDVETVSAGEIGLKFSDKINISTTLWKPIKSKHDECTAANG